MENENRKTGFEIMNEYENALVNLNSLPTILTFIIEDFGFENETLSEKDIENMIVRSDMIYHGLTLVRNIIMDVIEETKHINLNKQWSDMLGDKISEYMKQNNIDISTITDNTNLKTETITDMLSGKRPIYALEYVRICYALNVDVSTFINK